MLKRSRGDPLQQFLGFLQVLELFFGIFECSRVHPAPAALVFRGMAQMKHLVEEHVFDREARCTGLIQDTA